MATKDLWGKNSQKAISMSFGMSNGSIITKVDLLILVYLFRAKCWEAVYANLRKYLLTFHYRVLDIEYIYIYFED